jgi:putative FmdB family regulatory protein
MPTYEYRCQACNKEFTMVQSVAEHDQGKVACPQCQSEKVQQLMSVFIGKTSRKS